MNAKALIIWLIVGAVAGWLAGMVVKGGGYGLIGNIIVGIVGGLVADILNLIDAVRLRQSTACHVIFDELGHAVFIFMRRIGRRRPPRPGARLQLVATGDEPPQGA
jgi:uncharacterized membrane protein YeaQ/YmgE (transglycosylase-associated protein family)